MARRRSGSRCRSTSSARWSIRRGVPGGLRDRVFRAVVDDGALLNNAATEEGGGSPARGAIPGTIADGRRRRHVAADRGEDLGHLAAEPDPRVRDRAPGRARIPLEVGSWLVDLSSATGWRGCPGSRPWGCAARRPAGSPSTGWPSPAMPSCSAGSPRDRSARARAGCVVRDRGRGDLSRGGGGRPDRRGPLGARPPTR